jgi:trimeric autotransporter adhesin
MKNFFKKAFVAAAISSASINNAQAATINITDADLTSGTYNWTQNNVYVLDGLVFLESGGVLNIQEGTVVKFKEVPTNSDPASALIITRGAQIFAIGTPTEPIIFTAEDDDVNDPTDFGPSDVQYWAGLVILGKAKTLKNGSYEVNVEGIPTTEPRGLYGAINNDPNNFDDNDNSGVLKYVSIRHTGFGLASGSELQGLTLGGVGRGTTIDYVESYASSDDGIEIFGGTVDIKHFVSAFAEDDTYDLDEGWTGRGQFWFGIQTVSGSNPDTGFEFDGSTPDNTSNSTVGPTNTKIFNATMIGSGKTASVGGTGMIWRAGIQGLLANSIIGDYKGKCLEVKDDAGNTTTDAYAQLVAGNLNFKSNDFFDCGNATDLSSIIKITTNADDAAGASLITNLTTGNNRVANPSIVSIDREQNNILDPRPSSIASSVYSGTLETYPNDTFFTAVNYRGAFSANAADFWLNGWTALWQNDHLANISTGIFDKHQKSFDVSVYPIPASGSFVVDFKNNNIEKVVVIGLNGMTSLVYHTKGKNNIEVDTSNFSDGLYIVRLIDAEGNISVKKIPVSN